MQSFALDEHLIKRHAFIFRKHLSIHEFEFI
ncbi:hypothetical protein Y030_6069 [Burkholderia pseudomallei MSHR332]|nr:hypothetical protein Y030_6069 [Burkholderia pseudomallei MSHR332]